MFHEDICIFLTVIILKLNFLLVVICIAKNFIWTTFFFLTNEQKHGEGGVNSTRVDWDDF